MKETTMMTTMSGMMDAEQRMTSLTIAQVTGKMHKDVLKAIRNMEPATRTPKVSFALVTLSRRPSVFTLPRSSAMRLAHDW